MLPPSMRAKAGMPGPRGARNAIMSRSRKKKERIFVNTDTGDSLGGKKVKKESDDKKQKMSTIMSIYLNWRDLICKNIGMDLIAENAVGGDRGHIKNLLTFFGGYDKTFEAISILVTRWKDIQKKFSIAKNKDIPSLYLADTLKNDLLAVMCGKSALTGEAGGAHRADGQSLLIGKSQEDLEAYFKGGTK